MFGRDAVGQALERVTGLAASYHCPDLGSVERHIVANRARIADAGDRAPRTVAQLRHDVDLLLDRWLWLRQMSEDR